MKNETKNIHSPRLAASGTVGSSSLRAQSSRNSFLKVAVGDIRYVDKAHSKKQTVGSILTDLATTAVTGKSTTQHDEYALRCVRLS